MCLLGASTRVSRKGARFSITAKGTVFTAPFAMPV